MPPEGRRPAIDFHTILEAYGPHVETDRLYSAEVDLLEDAEYDLGRAGARLLGRDVGRLASPGTRARLPGIFRAGAVLDRLLAQLASDREASGRGEAWDEVKALCEAFRRGLEGAS